MSTQTNLKSDAFCMYNQSSAPFFWVLEPGQYENTYSFGEVGISAAGGTAGSYVRADVIDISSFLSGRDDMLSKCQPPVPDLEDVRQDPLRNQNEDTTLNLLPDYTREKRSAIDLSSVDYNRWQPLDTVPENLRFVIEDFSAQRGGLDTRNYTKLAWNPTELPAGSSPNADKAKNLCKAQLSPSWACGEFCEGVTGYPGVNPLTGAKKTIKSTMLDSYENRPSQEPEYPFTGPYSQEVYNVSGYVGDNFFYGPNFDKGTSPSPLNHVLEGSAVSLSKFPLFSS